MSIKEKFKNWYGNWSARYGEGFFLYGAFSSTLTSLWIIQNILKDSFDINAPLWLIGIIFTILFSTLVFFIDKLELIEARVTAVFDRNKYFKKENKRE